MPSSLLNRLANRLDPPPDPYLHDFHGWVKTKLDEWLWSKQLEIAQSVHDNRYTAVHSCHDSGKSHLSSRLAAHFIDTHPAGQAFLVSTAPTFAQVRAILWRYIGQAHRKGKLQGHVNQTEWHIGPELVGYGRKPADYDESAFQGIHADDVLIIIDEACGVPESIFNAVDALATNIGARVLAIGNPDDPASHFAAVCRPNSGWQVIHIDGLATPNFTGEVVPAKVARALLSVEWVEERKVRWGENSPLYIAKVRGLFPEDADDTVVPLSWVTRQRHVDHPIGAGYPVELGFDVGEGGDESVIMERRGAKLGRVWRCQLRNPEDLIDWAVPIIDEVTPTAIKVDATGSGWGICGGLVLEGRRDGHHETKVVRVKVGQSSFDSTRFPRLRDQIWWELGREMVEPTLCAVCGERHGVYDFTDIDDQTVAQLTATKYGIDTAGRVKIEKKDETRARIGRSPDDADALLLAYLEMPEEGTLIHEEEDRVNISDY